MIHLLNRTRSFLVSGVPLLLGLACWGALVAGPQIARADQPAFGPAPQVGNAGIGISPSYDQWSQPQPTDVTLSRQMFSEMEGQSQPMDVPSLPPLVPEANTSGVYSSDPLAASPSWQSTGLASSTPIGMQSTDSWHWKFLPTGLIYRSYLAGGREPRFGAQVYHDRDEGGMLDATLGARVAFIRYGTDDPLAPEGWELDVEAAAFPRLTMDEYRDMVSADFRYGLPLTYRRGALQWKFAFYHLSSHLADEYMLSGRPYQRLNFVRDGFVLGVGWFVNPNLRLYSEAGWAFHTDGGSEPWEFQFGLDYSPLEPVGFHGAPFLALNGRLREEVDFGGNFTAEAGWQWRTCTGKLLRFGAYYFNGQSDQYQFYAEHEEQIGLGLWYDF